MGTSLQKVVACAALVVATGGCTSEPRAACTLIGGIDGIDIDFTEVRAAHAGERLIVRACVDEECRTVSNKKGDLWSVVHVGEETITGDAPVLATLTISRADQSVLFDDEMRVRPVEGFPNGPKCPPTTWSAQLRATAEGRLVLS